MGGDSEWLFLVPLLLGIGLFGFLGVHECLSKEAKVASRSSYLGEYNTVVRRWNEVSELSFSSIMGIEVNGFRTSDSSILPGVHLGPIKTADTMKDGGEDVLGYNPLRFSFKGEVPRGEGWAVGEKGEITLNGMFPLPEELALTKEVEISMTNWKQCVHSRKGRYRNSAGKVLCTVHYRLASVCVVVGEGQGGWELVGGCIGETAEIAKYDIVPCGHMTPPRKVDARLSITVRHRNDPYLALRNITAGKLSFGTTSADSDRAASALLTVCFMFVLLLLIALFCKCRVRLCCSNDSTERKRAYSLDSTTCTSSTESEAAELKPVETTPDTQHVSIDMR